MAVRLWDKGAAADAAMLRYTARDDWQLDQRLLAYDLAATRAHVRGLGRIGILSADDVTALERELAELEAKTSRGELRLTDADEDGHTAIEALLVAALGDVGKRVHTGRSRNDQVLVALRMYERDALAELAVLTKDAARALLALARREAGTPMPGYTHLQRAMPSSLGLWAASFAEGFADASDVVVSVRAVCDRSPLGAAASFGVNLPLDRQGTALELGFEGPIVNPLWSQTSRGIVEAHVLSAAWFAMAVVRRLAWDLSLFTTSELGFVRLDDAFTTGSSIMPQKKNPDVVELMRAACAVVQGALVELQSVVALPSGYHRDLQLTKAPLFRALDESLATLRLVPRLVESLAFDRARMAAAITPETFATDRAVELTAQGVPFRDAYRQVASELDTLDGPESQRPAWTRGDPASSLAARISYGAPGNLALDDLDKRLA